ncbi:MAG TPA: NAD(P)H-dependent oxidoreductase subunit E, partial [Desulfosporosinus sp.]|nr:NAD(P)H-dependent oxidoreductase subunit E [Desulfosporosinus sp.]
MCTACEELVDPKQLELDKVIIKYQHENGPLIPILQEAQEVYGYLPPHVLKHISKETRIPLAKIYGVVTFYSQFRLSPVGRN